MKPIQRVVLLAALLTPLLAHATAHAEMRSLRHEGLVDAPIGDVWSAFTTQEGIEGWMCAKGEVDFRVGGRYRTTYVPDAELGGPHTIVNEILAYEPQRMIAMRNVGAPDSFQWTEKFQQTWSVIHFESIGEDRTRVVLTGYGYGEGEEWDQLYAFFDQGNDMVLAELQSLFASDDRPIPAERDKAAMELARRLTGGHWIAESQAPDGSMFYARNTLTLGADGESVIGSGWLGGADGLHRHGDTQIWRAAQGGGVWFQNINEQGDVAKGLISRAGDNTLTWDWDVETAEGRTESWDIAMTFEGEDAYVMRMKRSGEEGDLTEGEGIRFERVEELPERFASAGGAGGRSAEGTAGSDE